MNLQPQRGTAGRHAHPPGVGYGGGEFPRPLTRGGLARGGGSRSWAVHRPGLPPAVRLSAGIAGLGKGAVHEHSAQQIQPPAVPGRIHAEINENRVAKLCLVLSVHTTGEYPPTAVAAGGGGRMDPPRQEFS